MNLNIKSRKSLKSLQEKLFSMPNKKRRDLIVHWENLYVLRHGHISHSISISHQLNDLIDRCKSHGFRPNNLFDDLFENPSPRVVKALFRMGLDPNQAQEIMPYVLDMTHSDLNRISAFYKGNHKVGGLAPRESVALEKSLMREAIPA